MGRLWTLTRPLVDQIHASLLDPLGDLSGARYREETRVWKLAQDLQQVR